MSFPSSLQALRGAHHLTRLVLVWMALFVAVSVASPLLYPQAAQMVCSATGGVKMVSPVDGQADDTQAKFSMDCPLCAHLIAPPAPLALGFAPLSGLTHALRPIPAAHIAWVSGSPLPPRGPPALS